MGCRDFEAVLSALHDDEPVTPDERAQAEGHCDSCASCASFRRGLSALDRVRAPETPPAMVEHIMSALDTSIERESLDGSPALAETPRAMQQLAPALERPKWAPAWLDRKRLWIATGSIAVGAAALSAVILWGLRPQGTLGTFTSEDFTRQSPAASVGTPAAPGSVGAAGADAKRPAGTAPDAVTFNGRVYVPGAAVDASGSLLTTIGVLASSFDTAGAAVQATVYRQPLSDGSLLVRTPDGVFRYDPVTRTFDDQSWQLTSARPLSHFGEWPRLPSTFPEPTSANGSPTFRAAGKDKLGVAVYTPGGAKPTAGFAIAPGTAAGDPARGNPYWTWWVQLIKP